MLLALHGDFLLPSLRGSRSVRESAGLQGRGVGSRRLKFPLRMCFLVRTQAGAIVGSAVQPDSGEIMGFGEPQLQGLQMGLMLLYSQSLLTTEIKNTKTCAWYRMGI